MLHIFIFVQVLKRKPTGFPGFYITFIAVFTFSVFNVEL